MIKVDKEKIILSRSQVHLLWGYGYVVKNEDGARNKIASVLSGVDTLDDSVNAMIPHVLYCDSLVHTAQILEWSKTRVSSMRRAAVSVLRVALRDLIGAEWIEDRTYPFYEKRTYTICKAENYFGFVPDTLYTILRVDKSIIRRPALVDYLLMFFGPSKIEEKARLLRAECVSDSVYHKLIIGMADPDTSGYDVAQKLCTSRQVYNQVIDLLCKAIEVKRPRRMPQFIIRYPDLGKIARDVCGRGEVSKSDVESFNEIAEIVKQIFAKG